MTPAACEAAARAWLERLPAAERLAAHARTDLRLVVWLGAAAVLTATCLVLARADLGGRLRRAVEGHRPRPWLASALTAAAVAAVVVGVKGLYDILIAGRLEGSTGSLAGLATVFARDVWSAAILAFALAPPLQWLFRVRPRAGPLMGGVAAVAACAAIGSGPYAFGEGPALAPAPAGPVRDGLVRLIVDSGVPAHGVELSRNPAFEADVTGGFGQAHVVIGARVVRWPAAEARAYVGHLMGHYMHADVVAVFLIYGLVALGALAAIGLWAAPLARRLGAREATSAGTADALPAAAMILIFALGVGTLTTVGYLRWANVRADAFSLEHAREPDGLAAVLERTWDHESVDPSLIEAALFYSHPPLGERLAHAMCWKATRAN